MDTSRAHIVVLGAGVIGLQTAKFCLDAGFEVSIVAKNWPGDSDRSYASPMASAQWRPSGRPESSRSQDWDTQTFRYWLDYIKKVPSQESGVELKKAVLYWDQRTEEAQNPSEMLWWSSLVPDFRVLEETELPKGVAAGVAYQSFAIAPAVYLRHLYSQCVEAGAKIATADAQQVSDVFRVTSLSPAAGVVNCTGLSARELVPDGTMYPIKGQTITVEGEASELRVRTGGRWDAWVIPHPGTGMSLIGGCKLPHDGSTEISDSITSWILSSCASLAPELCRKDGNFDVVSAQVGFRPARAKGARVEVEWLTRDDGGSKFICHNYGHSHCGYENSVGAAREAVRLVSMALEQKGWKKNGPVSC